MITPTILVKKLGRDPVMGREVLTLHRVEYRSYRDTRRLPEPTMKLRLIIDVDYELNGADPAELRGILETIPSVLSGDQVFSGFTDARITEVDYSVLDRAMIHQHMLDLEDPEHASAFMQAAAEHLSHIKEGISAEELGAVLEDDENDEDTSSDVYIAWQPFKDYPPEKLLEFIVDRAISILNHSRS